MKLFVALIFCSLAPFILANDYYGSSTNCKCVDREQCSHKFSSLIEPRSPPKHNCAAYQVCCKPEHIIPSDYEVNAYDDDSDYQPAYNSHRGKCGQRTKISAYKRLVLPAAWAALGEFPWQAAILKNYSEGFVFVSSGVLIDRDIILTTAHNVDKLKANNILVRLGENNVQADPNRRYHHVNARVSKVIVKNDFNKDTLENDFAVLCLEKKVKCNEVVSPICLPEPKDYISETARCVVSGWGKGSYNGNYSTILRKAYLNLVPREKCQFLIRKRINDPSYVLDKSFQCAGGEKGKDACAGDAGGPLSCLNKKGQQVLAGIVSWGIGCGDKGVPGVYSNVRDPASLDWIKNVAIKACRKPAYSAPVKVVSPSYNGISTLADPVVYNGPNYHPNLASLPAQVAAGYNVPANQNNYPNSINNQPWDSSSF